MKRNKIKAPKTSRVLVPFNTGTRQHKPRKGAGSYNRQNFKAGE